MAGTVRSRQAFWTGVGLGVIVVFGAVLLLAWGLGADFVVALVIAIFVAVVVGGGIGLLIGAGRMTQEQAGAQGED